MREEAQPRRLDTLGMQRRVTPATAQALAGPGPPDGRESLIGNGGEIYDSIVIGGVQSYKRDWRPPLVSLYDRPTGVTRDSVRHTLGSLSADRGHKNTRC